MSDDELVPRWLRVLFAILRAAPMTEVKTAAGLVLLAGTAIWLVIAESFRVPINDAVLDSWLLFLSGLLAITSFGQGWKQTVTAKFGGPATPPLKDGAT